MSVMECYKRQNRIKKPFFLLCMVFLASCLVFWSHVAIVNSNTILDHLFVAYLYFTLTGWFPIWFKVESTPKEVEESIDQCLKMLTEYETNMKKERPSVMNSRKESESSVKKIKLLV